MSGIKFERFGSTAEEDLIILKCSKTVISAVREHISVIRDQSIVRIKQQARFTFASYVETKLYFFFPLIFFFLNYFFLVIKQA